jgi:CDP-diacylglycerol--serine O-phosphatidyltransferase
MIGFYNYTVILTYLSLAFAGTGIAFSFMPGGHPFIGVICLLLCALCDGFDGKVARTKKDRTPQECKFGIQIDSLSDVIAFGVLPACIGMSILFNSKFVYVKGGQWRQLLCTVIAIIICIVFMLMALIRLAYFNVTEEERQNAETGTRKTYLGLPVTLGAIMLPIPYALQMIIGKLTELDLSYTYFAALLIIAILFVSKFQLAKPGAKKMTFMITMGVIEATALVVAAVL